MGYGSLLRIGRVNGGRGFGQGGSGGTEAEIFGGPGAEIPKHGVV